MNGEQMVARVDELRHGYDCWKGGRIVDSRLGRFADGFIPPARRQLGDDDQSLWQTDNRGDPRDPWVFCFYLPLVSGRSKYLFPTSSWGGKKAMRNICDAYSRRADPDSVPIVELGVFQRRSKEYGLIPEPLLDVTGWASREPPDEAPGEPNKSPPSGTNDYAAAKGRAGSQPVERPSAKEELEDEIPF